MLFNSFQFAVFFPLVSLGFFLLPRSLRWVLLLVASYWFYMAWEPAYAVLLVISTFVDHFAARAIAASTDGRVRKRWLWLSLATNLGILAGFKYYNFLNDNLRSLAEATGHAWPLPDLDVLLPMGISFYTFQTMSYTIDVYRGHLAPARNLGKFALYVSFFPQLVAGPIERATNLLPQFDKDLRPDRVRIVHGLKQMLWGFFKKVVIADRAGAIVDVVYNSPGQHDGWTLALATLMFSAQIYGDFSGYSDIAIGAARVLGYDLMVNFRTPYLSTSLREFWQRWHISLLTWFRDYVYIPLGGSRGTPFLWYRNILVVFLISGLWHGAAWTYVLFGVLHGVYVAGGRAMAPMFERVDRWIGWRKDGPWSRASNILVVFLLVNIGWVLFRSNDLQDAWSIFGKILGADGSGSGPLELVRSLGAAKVLTTVALVVGFLLADPFMDLVVKGERHLRGRWSSLLVYATLMALLVLFGHYGEVRFIYFQF